MGAFQEFDQVAMTTAATKAASRATSADALADEIVAAIRSARLGRHGPVHVALPVDVLTSPLASAAMPSPKEMTPQPRVLTEIDSAAIFEFLRDGQYPLILAGRRSRS